MWLEKLALKIPPPVIFILFVILIALLNPQQAVGFWGLFAAFNLIFLGAFISLSALWQFYKNKTTVNPHHLQNTQTLITDGIFRFTRNPMYLTLLLWLIAWSIYWQQQIPYLNAPLFIIYLHYFQILPEEKWLAQKFGQTYQDYCWHTSRWIGCPECKK